MSALFLPHYTLRRATSILLPPTTKDATLSRRCLSVPAANSSVSLNSVSVLCCSPKCLALTCSAFVFRISQSSFLLSSFYSHVFLGRQKLPSNQPDKQIIVVVVVVSGIILNPSSSSSPLPIDCTRIEFHRRFFAGFFFFLCNNAANDACSRRIFFSSLFIFLLPACVYIELAGFGFSDNLTCSE